MHVFKPRNLTRIPSFLEVINRSGPLFQLMTLRGSVLEDAIPSTAKHSTARGLPLKEVLEHVIPELNVQCLRLAFNTPKVTEQLMKLDEQGVSVASREHASGSGLLPKHRLHSSFFDKEN